MLKKKHLGLIFAFAFTFFTFEANAQKDREELEKQLDIKLPIIKDSYVKYDNGLIIVKSKKPKGYYFMDKSGNVVSDVYSRIVDYNEGYRVVAKDNLYGAIDSLGAVAIPVIYKDILLKISEGVTGVSIGDKKWYLIDIHGNILSAGYDGLGFCKNGMVLIIQNSKHGLINKKGEVAVEPVNHSIMRGFNEKYCWLMNDNVLNLYSISEHKNISKSYDDFCITNGIISLVKDSSKKWGIIDNNDLTVIPFMYDDLDDAKKLFNHMDENKISKLNEMELKRLLLSYDPMIHKYRIGEKIPNNNWIY